LTHESAKYYIDASPNPNPFGDMTDHESIKSRNLDNSNSGNASGGLLKEISTRELI
jgi:hypothetical protein